MEQKKYRRLSFEERVKIEAFLEANKSKCFIAEQLGRNRSTITNELKKWIRNKDEKSFSSCC